MIPEIVRFAVPVLVRVTACAGLVVPLVCVPKVKLVGDKLAAGVPACAARLYRKTRLDASQTRLRALP